MTYYGGREMAASFRTVRNNTLKIAEEIPEESYGFTPAGGARTVAQTLAHIAAFPRLQLHLQQNQITDLATLNFPALIGEIHAVAAQPRSKAELIEMLTKDGQAFASYLEALPEPFLAEPVKMLPDGGPATKSRLEMLLSVKEHEMHHRAQLMTAQRILGMTPPLTRAREARMAAAAQGQR
jgi:uncharacterized damage-inducible protein DinB